MRGAGVEHPVYNVHAGVRVALDGREAVERPCRYVLRPAICASRITLLEDGREVYRTKHPRHGGETHRVMSVREFPVRVAALIPPPRYPQVR